MSFPVSLIPPEPKAYAALLVAGRAERLRPGDTVYDRLAAQIRQTARAVFTDLEPLLAAARAARTRRAAPTKKRPRAVEF